MLFSLDFIAKLYNNRNSYADVFTHEELQSLHVESGIEQIIKKFIEQKKLIILTGNPGDGKTHIIRSLSSTLQQYSAFIELDANSIKDEESFLVKLEESINEGKPAILAINEFPLLSLLESLTHRFPGYGRIMSQREKGIVYNKGSEETLRDVVVIDLNNRNLLSKEMLEKTLSKLLNSCKTCSECNGIDGCSASINLQKLKDPIVQQRLLFLIEKVGSIGLHVVMRDILGFFAYVITSGKKCKSRRRDIEENYDYFNLMFSGENDLFASLSIFDPIHYSHPSIDENLWNGTLSDGWFFGNSDILVPEESDDPLEAFKTMKRKFYFEHERGEELLDLLPLEYKSYYNALIEGFDRQEQMIRKIILGINMFFDPDDQEDDKLKIWTTHKYELRTRPRVAVSSRYAYLNQVELLTPRLPDYLKEMEYVPDHFMFRVYKFKEYKYVDLRIDLDLYRVLVLVQSGYPSQLVPEQHQFKLLRFMNELASLESVGRTNVFIIRDMDNRSSYRVKVNGAKYELKRG